MTVTHISAQSIHARLLTEQAALRADVGVRQDAAHLSAWGDTFADGIDASAAITQREAEKAQRRGLEARLRRVEAALQRIAIGTYGTCEICGGEIPLERLEILPTAVRCVRHVV